MAKFSTSEIFFSIEGEARYAGSPTVYARLAGCNFTCKGFNNPENLDTTSVEVLGFNPKDYKDIYSIPVITRGCDSIYSWDKKFAHMWKTYDEHQLAEQLLKLLPGNSFVNPISGKRCIVSLTGGEPSNLGVKLLDLINAPEMKEAKIILIETNCSVKLRSEFRMGLNKWLCEDPERKWIWSNSPKLSISGEQWDKAIRPEIAASQLTVTGREFGHQVEQYFKFVCGPDNKDYDEVTKAMEEYYAEGIPRNTDIYIMPVSCTNEQQENIAAVVAQQCMNRGLIYCHRVHSSVFGNVVGY